MITRQKPQAVFLLGPTASGKTAAGIALSRSMPCRLISVDSSLVYRGLDIGTAKPSASEQQQAPHHLIDICEPWETYSAAQFCRDAKAQINQAVEAGELPVLLGGTMLYFNALEHGLAEMPEADPAVRASLSARAERNGWASMHKELSLIDPAAAARIHPQDPQRIQRALEVWQLTGKNITDWHREGKDRQLGIPLLKIGLYPEDRGVLHQRIAERFDAMLLNGFLAEVEALKRDPRINASLPSMRSVGYRQAWAHLDARTTFNEFREQAVAATRQLCKRQLTWMRSMEQLHLIDSTGQSPAEVAKAAVNTIREKL